MKLNTFICWLALNTDIKISDDNWFTISDEFGNCECQAHDDFVNVGALYVLQYRSLKWNRPVYAKHHTSYLNQVEALVERWKRDMKSNES